MNRISRIRQLQCLTQTKLGEKMGFPSATAKIRIAQYESETRIPQKNMVERIANNLKVTADSLFFPDIPDTTSAMHALFFLEEICGMSLSKQDDQVQIKINNEQFHQYLDEWQKMYTLYSKGEITEKEYCLWKYSFSARKK